MRPSRKKVAEAIARRLKGSESMAKLSKEVAAYLLENHRTSELEPIMRDIMEIRAEDGRVEALVVTAHKLGVKPTKDVRDLVRAISPKAKRLQLNEQIDPSLIGGLQLQVINQTLDLSIRGKLNKLRQLTAERII